MMTPAASHPQLRDLLALMADDRLDKADHARLNALLADDADARALYIDYTTIDAMLRWTNNAAAPAGLRGIRGIRDDVQLDRPVAAATPRGLTAGWRLAAALLIGAALVMIATAVWRADAPLAAPPGPLVAVLSDAEGLVLIESTDTAAVVGAELHSGWLSVPRGVAELTFRSGATVRLMGPARLRLDSHNRAHLASGVLAAEVPPAAAGFTVAVNEWRVVDLGTSFGITFTDTGDAAVHVFEGRVRMEGRGSPRVVEAGRAVRATSAGLADAALDRPAFAGLLLALAEAADHPSPPAEASLALWLSADRGVQRDTDERVQRWIDTRGHAPHGAMQIVGERRPTWVADGIAARPSVRFDGHRHLQLPTTESLGIADGDYELFIVAHSDDPGVQFLLAGSYVTGIERHELHLNGSVALRFIPAPTVYADLHEEAQAPGSPHVFAARVIGHTATVGIDGQDSGGIAMPPTATRWTGELTLGMRGTAEYGLRGDIAEVLIYNAALTDDDRAAVLVYLIERYGVVTGAEPAPAHDDIDGIGESESAQPLEGVDP